MWNEVMKFKVNTLVQIMKKKNINMLDLILMDRKVFIDNNKPSIFNLLGAIGKDIYNKTLDHYEAKRMIENVLDYMLGVK